MEQNQNNYITFEMNLKFQMKDYRLVLGIKRAWIIAIVVGLIQLATWQLHVLQNWFWSAQAKAIYESRTATWGSPRLFLKDHTKNK